MTDEKIYNIAAHFRDAIERARDAREFDGSNYLSFHKFPVGCCGNTADILAEYLLKHYNIGTIYVWGWKGDQSHGWLMLKDSRVRNTEQNKFDYPDEIKEVMRGYGAENLFIHSYESYAPSILHYSWNDIRDGLAIDIASDWIGGARVYVDYMNDFYEAFDFRDAHDQPSGLTHEKAQILRIIEEYL